MSVEAMAWALNVPVGGNAKVILLGLANHAHADGSETYPSIQTLARYACCNRSTVKRNIDVLEETGWIALDGHGPRGQNKYRLAMGVQNAPGAPVHPQGGAPVHPEPSIEPSTSLSTERETSEPERTELVLLDAPWSRARAEEGKNGALPVVSLFGKPCTPTLVQDAVAALAYYCEHTGQRLRPFTARGKPSDSLTRILRSMTDHPEVRTVYRRMIDRVLADPPYWDGHPHVGVIFGPGAVEKSIVRAESDTPSLPDVRGLTPSGRAIAKLLVAGQR